MSLISRVINWALGNGYDLKEHEDTVRRHKEDAKGCIESSQTHFSLMQKKFDDVPTPDPETKKVSDEHPSTDCVGA